MTKYGEVIRRVLDNANIENEDSNKRQSIRRDIEDVLNDMFLNTESPIKTSSFNVNENEPVVELLSLVGYNSIVIDGITSAKDLYIALDYTNAALDYANVTIKLVKSSGEVLIDEDLVFGEELHPTSTLAIPSDELPIGGTSGTPIVSFAKNYDIVFTDIVGATLTITNVKSPGTLPDDTGSQFTFAGNFNYTETQSFIALPSDIYVPFEVVFKVSEKTKSAIYNSKELLEEEFMRWNPNGASDLNSEVLSSELKASVTEPTIENLEFDYHIGYFFKMGENNLELHFKPASQATVMIRHSYLPTTSVNETNPVPLHRAFNNCLVYGTTLKQLEKALMRATTEIDIVRIRTAISRYAPQYAQAVSHYAGFNRRKTDVHVVKMFGICDDPYMMR